MNPQASKRKGRDWESAVVAALRSAGWTRAERRRLAGSKDLGDVINGPEDWTLEAKNERSISLSQYMREAKAEAVNAGTKWYAAIVKARNKPTRDAYVVMPLSVFMEVCAVLESKED